MNTDKGIILIGMPGAGKSTLGKALAEHYGMSFVDTDTLLEKHLACPLQHWLDEHGYLSLREEEEKAITNTTFGTAIIATGGSVIYSKPAIQHLRQSGPILYLRAQEQTLRDRIDNFSRRGIARRPDQSFHSLYLERSELYEYHADVVIDCDEMDVEQGLKVLNKIL